MRGIRGSYLALLFVVVTVVLLQPVLPDHSSRRLLIDLLFSSIFLSIFFGLRQQNKWFSLVVVLGIIGLLIRWSWYLGGDFTSIQLAGKLFNFSFLVITSVLIVLHVVRAQVVSFEVIAGAISAYFLIAYAFADAYTVIEHISPGAFKIPNIDSMNLDALSSRGVFVYYSFVTLTTLGFGDMTPVSDFARSVTILEAVVGQMFIAILVAGLVSAGVAQKSLQSSPSSGT